MAGAVEDDCSGFPSTEDYGVVRATGSPRRKRAKVRRISGDRATTIRPNGR